MLNNLFILIVALFMVIKGATLATKYAGRLAESYRLSKYVTGFILIAIISILPEMFISINAAVKGIPSFGLGMLFGSNVADLTLVFAIIIFWTGRGLRIESKILKNHLIYSFLLLLPLVLGLDGHFSRLEGAALILVGIVFYYISLRNAMKGELAVHKTGRHYKNFLMLVFSMALLILGSHFIVTSASALAGYLLVSPVLIGMLVVGLGTIMPELLFSLKSAEEKESSMAVGDILGTVLADATIVVGILALVKPFYFPEKIIYVTGVFMVAASFVLFHFMRSGRTVSKREAWLLLLFWGAFVLVEFFANT